MPTDGTEMQPPHPIGPADDLRLLQALEEWLQQSDATTHAREAAIEGAAPEIRGQLSGLIETVDVLRASAAAVEQPTLAYRQTARARLMDRIAAEGTTRLEEVREAPRRRAQTHAVLSFRRRATPWLARVAAGLVAIVLVGGGTLTVSASALPGEPLYGLKTAAESVALQLAADESMRTDLRLRFADTRLDEVDRLVQDGRTQELDGAVRRYEASVEQALNGATVVGEAQRAQAERSEVDDRLAAQETRLAALLARAPEAAQPGLETAQKAVENGRRGASSRAPDGRGLGLGQAPLAPTPGGAVIPTPVSSRTPASVASPEPTGETGRESDRPVDQPGRRGAGPGEERTPGAPSEPPGPRPRGEEPPERGRPAPSAALPTPSPVPVPPAPAPRPAIGTEPNRGRSGGPTPPDSEPGPSRGNGNGGAAQSNRGR
ncbi:MAG: hypothetical protein HYX52_09800 [Chloroflexi bacterium]|nr:hypothetical protein [Chloroflexota bacterium]